MGGGQAGLIKDLPPQRPDMNNATTTEEMNLIKADWVATPIVPLATLVSRGSARGYTKRTHSSSMSLSTPAMIIQSLRPSQQPRVHTDWLPLSLLTVTTLCSHLLPPVFLRSAPHTKSV